MKNLFLLLSAFYLAACSGVKTTEKANTFSQCQQTFVSSSEQILRFATDKNMDEKNRAIAINLRCNEFYNHYKNAQGCTKESKVVVQDLAINERQIRALCDVSYQSQKAPLNTFTNLTLKIKDEKINFFAGRNEGEKTYKTAEILTYEAAVRATDERNLTRTSYKKFFCSAHLNSKTADLKKNKTYPVVKSIITDAIDSTAFVMTFLEIQVDEKTKLNLTCLTPESPTLEQFNQYMSPYFQLQLKTPTRN